MEIKEPTAELFSNLFSDETINGLYKSPDEARGLPNEAFTSEAFCDLERERLFPQCWVFAGRASQVPEPGNRAVVEIGGRPYFMVRDDRGQIRVFNNVCPHRGSRIVPCSENGGPSITCPYHSWTFNLDGGLAARPHFHGPEAHDVYQSHSENYQERPHLFEARSMQWFDWVFVNPDGQAPSFEEYVRPAKEKLAGYPMSQFQFEAVESIEFDCNWKLVAENWIDMYHIFRVHPDLNSFMQPAARCGMQWDEGFIYNQYTMTRPSRALGLEPAKGTDQVQGLVTFGLLFPCAGITVDPTNVLFANFVPLASDRTRMDMYFYFPEDVTGSDVFRDARQTYRNWWIELNTEDENVCRLLQLGRQSPAYDGGRFAPYWDSATLHYYRSIVDCMTGTDKS